MYLVLYISGQSIAYLQVDMSVLSHLSRYCPGPFSENAGVSTLWAGVLVPDIYPLVCDIAGKEYHRYIHRWYTAVRAG